MILLATRHFCLLCISVQHFILCFSMCSSASFVLLLMYSIQSSSFSMASISSSASCWKDTSLSWSFIWVLLRAFICFFVRRTFFVFFFLFFGAFFLFFVSCNLFRFIFSFRLYSQAKHLSLRGLDHLLVFQRQCPRAAGISHRRCYHHVEKAKSLWQRRSSFDVNSWRYLWKAAHAAFNLFLISSVSWSSNVIFCPRYLALAVFPKISILMLSTVISFYFYFSWLLSIFVLSGCMPRPTASVLILNSQSISP